MEVGIGETVVILMSVELEEGQQNRRVGARNQYVPLQFHSRRLGSCLNHGLSGLHGFEGGR